jgi:hypothetical protein
MQIRIQIQTLPSHLKLVDANRKVMGQDQLQLYPVPEEPKQCESTRILIMLVSFWFFLLVRRNCYRPLFVYIYRTEHEQLLAFDENCEAYVLCHSIQKQNVTFLYIICGSL